MLDWPQHKRDQPPAWACGITVVVSSRAKGYSVDAVIDTLGYEGMGCGIKNKVAEWE